MKDILVRFHAELNDFLVREQRDRSISVSSERRASVKDIIEALGVPHPEVDVVLVNGQQVGFAYVVREGDRIEVHPSSTAGTAGGEPRVPLRPPHVPLFVLDQHLGTLARSLRMLGFDTLYRNDYDDEELATIAGTENRILLTRDRGLLKRGSVVHGYFVRAQDAREQVREVLHRFDLYEAIQPYKRCIRCNHLLHVVAKEHVAKIIPAKTRELFNEYRQCSGCGRVYWRGSHHARMERFIAEIRAATASPSSG